MRKTRRESGAKEEKRAAIPAGAGRSWPAGLDSPVLSVVMIKGEDQNGKLLQIMRRGAAKWRRILSPMRATHTDRDTCPAGGEGGHFRRAAHAAERILECFR